MDVLGLLIPIAGLSLVGFIVFITHYFEDKKSKEKTNEEKEKENTIACIKLQPECDKNEK